MSGSSHPALELATELIGIASDTTAGEARIAALLADRLDAAGVAAEVLQAGGRTNLVARLPGIGGRPLYLSGHLDTVSAATEDGWRRDPFVGTLEDGRLWGRGSSDMKGGVAAAVTALQRWAQRPESRRPNVTLVLSGGEELGCLGAAGLATGLEPASAILVLEPTGCRPRIGHRGVAWLEIEVMGLATHASTPERGSSAIRAAARLVPQLEQAPCESDETLGPASVSVGLIDGGSAPNVVPDRCRMTVDVRLNAMRSAGGWRDIARQLAPAGTRIDISLELAPVRADPASPTLRSLTASLGLPPAVGTVPFFTDASVLQRGLDAPVLICGPGDPATIHGPDESCPLDEIGEFADRLAQLGADWRTAPS